MWNKYKWKKGNKCEINICERKEINVKEKYMCKKFFFKDRLGNKCAGKARNVKKGNKCARKKNKCERKEINVKESQDMGKKGMKRKEMWKERK